MNEEQTNKQTHITNSQITASQGNIHIGDEITNISRMVIYLTTATGYSPSETHHLVEELENELQIRQAEGKDRETKQERYVASLGRAMSTALRDARDDQRRSLLKLTGEWVVPIIEKCKESDDYYSPYGTLCAYLINGMCPSNYYGFTPATSQISMRTVMNWIFTTDNLLKEVSGYEESNSVRFDILTKYFPVKSNISENYGFYFSTRYPVTEDGIFDRSTYGRDEGPLKLLYITDENMNGLLDIAKGEVTTKANEGLQGVAKRLTKAFASDNMHIFSVYFDKNKMYLWNTDKELLGHRKYSIQMDFKIFSAFLMGMVSDFLRLGSNAIDARRAHEKDIDRLLDLFLKK